MKYLVRLWEWSEDVELQCCVGRHLWPSWWRSKHFEPSAKGLFAATLSFSENFHLQRPKLPLQWNSQHQELEAPSTSMDSSHCWNYCSHTPVDIDFLVKWYMVQTLEMISWGKFGKKLEALCITWCTSALLPQPGSNFHIANIHREPSERSLRFIIFLAKLSYCSEYCHWTCIGDSWAWFLISDSFTWCFLIFASTYINLQFHVVPQIIQK
jgi:hypothetical protein